MTALLIVIIQLLLIRSKKNSGLLFASNINDLPLSKTFNYLYLPTIISVLYGFVWTWIDLDIRRLEPFYQLSKPSGATGQESLLLHYPVDFLASVPIKAVKFRFVNRLDKDSMWLTPVRQWSVFSASIATVFVFWGITPTQSGLFAVRTVNTVMDVPSTFSTSYQTLIQQKESLSAQSANSVSNIIWLNETLPPFMSRESVFAPFGPDAAFDGPIGLNQTTFVGNTQRYNVNIACEAPHIYLLNSSLFMNSSWGCMIGMSAPVTPQMDKNVFQLSYRGFYASFGRPPGHYTGLS